MGFIANYLLNGVAVALRRQPQRPLLVSYYVTHRCELDCLYCSDGAGKPFKADPVEELTTADAKRLISLVRKVTDTLDFTGGEPLVRDDLEELLLHAKATGLRTILNTKGLGLAQRGELLQLVDVLVLSIDSLAVERLAELISRPLPIAREILAGLEFAINHRKATGAQLVLSCVATPRNLADAAQVLEFAVEHGLQYQISPEIVGRTVHPQLRDNLEYQKLIEQVLGQKRQAKGILGVPAYLEGIRAFAPFACYPLLMPVVRPDGKLVYPCLELKQAAVSVLAAGDYWQALAQARRVCGAVPKCHDCCHLFCHMGLSLLQQHPLQALAELRHWRFKE